MDGRLTAGTDSKTTLAPSKAERQSCEVPTLPRFVHELLLSTAAIVRTLEDHRKRPDQGKMDAQFGDLRCRRRAAISTATSGSTG